MSTLNEPYVLSFERCHIQYILALVCLIAPSAIYIFGNCFKLLSHRHLLIYFNFFFSSSTNVERCRRQVGAPVFNNFTFKLIRLFVSIHLRNSHTETTEKIIRNERREFVWVSVSVISPIQVRTYTIFCCCCCLNNTTLSTFQV